jgi:peptidoglycan/LPS O-acetylase OafA/YrhL
VAVTPEVDRQAVAVGAGIGLAAGVLAIAAFQLFQVFVDVGDDSSWPLLFVPLLLLGWIFGGWVAARREPRAPYTAAILAALGSFLVIAVVASTIRVADGKGFDPFPLLTFAFVATTAGVLGGLLASLRA